MHVGMEEGKGGWGGLYRCECEQAVRGGARAGWFAVARVAGRRRGAR